MRRRFAAAALVVPASLSLAACQTNATIEIADDSSAKVSLDLLDDTDMFSGMGLSCDMIEDMVGDSADAEVTWEEYESDGHSGCRVGMAGDVKADGKFLVDNGDSFTLNLDGDSFGNVSSSDLQMLAPQVDFTLDVVMPGEVTEATNGGKISGNKATYTSLDVLEKGLKVTGKKTAPAGSSSGLSSILKIGLTLLVLALIAGVLMFFLSRKRRHDEPQQVYPAAMPQPGMGQPGMMQPGMGQPATAQPGTAQPFGGQPFAGQPGAAQTTSGQIPTGQIPSYPAAGGAMPAAGQMPGTGAVPVQGVPAQPGAQVPGQMPAQPIQAPVQSAQAPGLAPLAPQAAAASPAPAAPVAPLAPGAVPAPLAPGAAPTPGVVPAAHAAPHGAHAAQTTPATGTIPAAGAVAAAGAAAASMPVAGAVPAHAAGPAPVGSAAIPPIGHPDEDGVPVPKFEGDATAPVVNTEVPPVDVNATVPAAPVPVAESDSIDDVASGPVVVPENEEIVESEADAELTDAEDDATADHAEAVLAEHRAQAQAEADAQAEAEAGTRIVPDNQEVVKPLDEDLEQ